MLHTTSVPRVSFRPGMSPMRCCASAVCCNSGRKVIDSFWWPMQKMLLSFSSLTYTLPSFSYMGVPARQLANVLLPVPVVPEIKMTSLPSASMLRLLPTSMRLQRMLMISGGENSFMLLVARRNRVLIPIPFCLQRYTSSGVSPFMLSSKNSSLPSKSSLLIFFVQELNKRMNMFKSCKRLKSYLKWFSSVGLAKRIWSSTTSPGQPCSSRRLLIQQLG